MENKKKTFSLIIFSVFLCFSFLTFYVFLLSSFVSAQSGGASLYLAPPSGTYFVGDTLSVSIYVNTDGQSVNAIEALLTFPPDKLQIVSPSAGKSVIDVWVGQPGYSNEEGTISFRGAIPNPGLKVSQGLISTLTFRVKSVGKAVISFSDGSKVLLNDGKGTDVLSSTSGAIFDLTLPPPQGPVVVSPTHPDQSRWYNNANVVLSWSGNGDNSVSYVLDGEPLTTPDDIPEKNKDGVSYSNVPSGVHYFHVRAHNEDVWGGTTHFAIKVDNAPPAKFSINIEPRAYTSSRQPVITFDTSDTNSGLDHFEIKIIPLSEPTKVEASGSTREFFIETNSPYIPNLTPGKYDAIVRAYDKAGNVQEAKERLVILSQALQAIEWVIPSSWWGFFLLIILLLVSAYLAHHHYGRYAHASFRHNSGPENDAEIAKKLSQLHEYQKRYGHLVLVTFISISLLIGLSSKTLAMGSEGSGISSPIITTVSENISNNELFYVGGSHPTTGAFITIYLENEATGEVRNFTSVTDKKGDWFYASSDFLPVGSYVLWAQASVGTLESPPTPREEIEVEKTAINLGSSRISYEVLYGFLSLLFLVATLILLIRAYYYYHKTKLKHSLLMKEISEAEESIRRGFAMIKRDIENELSSIAKIKVSSQIRTEEQEREKQLLSDLRTVEENIGKEVWDIRGVA